MSIEVMQCPACGYALPPHTHNNELVTCPACGATLYLSDWEIGKSGSDVVVATPTRVYHIRDMIFSDDLCAIYRCKYEADERAWQGMFRLSKETDFNDLVQNEAQVLYHFQGTPAYQDFRHFLPQALENFIYQDATLKGARRVNIVGLHESIPSPSTLYSLEEVNHHYPAGIDQKDMAWMWRRLLFVLGYAHSVGVIHGAVLPHHILIEPMEHALVLTNWGYAVRDAQRTGSHIKAISATYEDWYPQEVFDRAPPVSGLDLFMAARTMLYVLGADPLAEAGERELDAPLRRYFNRLLSTAARRQPQDAWVLLDEFDKLIEGLWGPRSFREFTMPARG